jgi:hypothetical protein
MERISLTRKPEKVWTDDVFSSFQSHGKEIKPGLSLSPTAGLVLILKYHLNLSYKMECQGS